MLTYRMIVATESDHASPSSLRYLRSLRASALSFDFHTPSHSKLVSPQVSTVQVCVIPRDRAVHVSAHNSFRISVCEPIRKGINILDSVRRFW